MKGFKTVIFGSAVAIVPAALQYLMGIDWTTLVSPVWAPVVIGTLTVLLRLVTDSPVFRKYS